MPTKLLLGLLLICIRCIGYIFGEYSTVKGLQPITKTTFPDVKMKCFPIILFLLTSCSDSTKKQNNDSPPPIEEGNDNDGDGFGENIDCDDNNATIYPGAVLEATDEECMIDLDGDGFGDKFATPPFDPGGDCDDQDANAFPGAGFNEQNATECHSDGDGDGYGSATPNENVTPGSDAYDEDVNYWFQPTQGHWTYGNATITQNSCSEDTIPGENTEQTGFGIISNSPILFDQIADNGDTLACNLTGNNFSCPIDSSNETITVEGVDIDISISTTMDGTFSGQDSSNTNFKMIITCVDVDNWLIDCGDLGDYLPCEVHFDIPATLDQ